MKPNCRDCKVRAICITRIKLLTGESDEAIKNIAKDSDSYALIHQGITELLAENCYCYSE